jgi:uncharacterized protein YjbI with pentapeptide repeats
MHSHRRSSGNPAWLVIIGVALLLALPPSQRSSAAPDSERIQRLIEQLGSGSFTERESAMQSLLEIGKPALPALFKAACGDDLEIRRRAKALIPKIDTEVTALQARGAILHRDNSLPDKPVLGANLSQAAFTDADLVNLRGFHKMYSLIVCGPRITDAGIANLEHLTALTQLQLYANQLTDAELERLKKLDKLTTLNISNTKITDAGLAHLKAFRRLRVLNLDGNNVTDAGLVHLKELPALEYLDLNQTKVTDAGLVHLKELKKLKRLRVVGTKVTKEGMDDLKRSLPGLSD